MELERLLRSRRMTRDYLDRPVDDGELDRVLAAARRAPAAGNTDAVDLLVLRGPEVGQYWDVTLPPPRRSRFRWQGLLRAPVLVVPWVRPDAYVERYAEPDKAGTGLGDGPAAWTVPYWWVDGGMALMLVQLAALDRGLGVCLFGLFEHEPAVRERFGVPADRRALGALAIGHPAPTDEPGRSSRRPRRDRSDTVHLGRWASR